jgi:hypothetical protein
MFGYIKPLQCELKVHELETYRAYYCGLCKALKHEYTWVSSSVVSYDCAFLYMLADSIASGENRPERCACLLHPARGKTQILSASAPYSAAVNVLLSYYKLKDDIEDGKKQMLLAAPLLYPAYKKAAARFEETDKAVLMMHSALDGIQKKKSDNIDEPAGAFGVMLGKIFEKLDEDRWETLYDLGYNLGRWLYMIDAVDDLEKDEKTGNYNVFLEKYKESGHPNIREEADFNLYFSLARASEAYGRLPVLKNKGILENIFYIGLKEKTRLVLEGEKA